MIIALDLETTWLDPKKDKIIEIALICFDEHTFEVIDTFSTLIHPEISIPELNSNITWIFDDDVKDAPKWNEEMIQKVQNFIGDFPILWHNTYFDRDFLIQAGVDIADNIVLDTFILSNILLFQEKSLNLWSLCESIGIDTGSSHRAFDDTKATYELFKHLVGRVRSLQESQKKLLHHVFKKSFHPSFAFYNQYFDFEVFEKMEQEVFMKAVLKVLKKYVSQTLEPNQDATLEMTAETLFQKLPSFEARENQKKMAAMVESSLFDNKKMVIEAPTGVGKTFAYLIPSLLYAVKFWEPVLVSTNTKALQDQIFYKDLAYLKEHSGIDFSYAKLKGRKNYFSISQFFEAYFSSVVFDIDETSFYAKLLMWLFSTEFWELDELQFYPKEFQLLRNIHADHFLVLSEENKYKPYEFLFHARSQAQQSHIVIINHSILLQDIKSKNGVFPHIKNLIIDEAHNLEDTTTQALKKVFHIWEFQPHVQKLLASLLKQSKTLDGLEVIFEQLWQNISLIFDIFSEYAAKKNTYANEVFEVGIEKDFYTQDLDLTHLFGAISDQFSQTFHMLDLLDDKTLATLKTFISYFQEVDEILSICWNKESSEQFIPIFTHNIHTGNSLSYTLLHPGKFLKTELYNSLDSLVVTSATLQINQSFDYFQKILCFDETFEFFILESDFDYKKQAFLMIPNNLWSARYNNPVMLQFLLDFITLVKGKTLVLMTSFSSIRDAYLFLNLPLKKLWVDVLAQSLWGSKQKIINHYKKFYEKSIIIGTDSFWEGVDFPWEELKYLVIHKFPFDVPTDPIFKARSKLFRDSFLEYSIPKAIIKTKQGFWRLIRTKNDSGVVILLDERVSQTSWWSVMLESFPKEINTKIGNSEQFLQAITQKQNT